MEGIAGSSRTTTVLSGDAFAESLYNSIWIKFGIVAPDHHAPSCSRDVHDSQKYILKAVICEQLLLRDFLKNHFFFYKKPLILGNLDSALTFCNALCIATGWGFFKRILRCSAFIAEFFLYRCSNKLDQELYKAPMIWCTVFKEHFADHFRHYNEWGGLNNYSKIYSDEVYVSLDMAISQMTLPYGGVPLNCLQNLPRLEYPETDPTRVYTDMYMALNCVDAFRLSESPASSPLARKGNGVAHHLPSTSSPKVESTRWKLDVKGLTEAVNGFFLTRRNLLDPAIFLENPALDPVVNLENPALDPVVNLENPAPDPDVNLENPAPDPDVNLENPASDPIANLENPAPGPVSKLENPADPDNELKVALNPNEEREEAMSMDVEEPSKGPEDELSEDVQLSPDSRSRKRSRKRSDTSSDDINPPSPKQLKPDSAE